MSGQATTSAEGAVQQGGTDHTKSRITSAIFGVWGILWTLVALVFVAMGDMLSGLPVGEELAGLGWAIAAIFLILAVVAFAIAYGIWKALQWGWYGGMIVSVLSGLMYLYGLLQSVDGFGIVLFGISTFCVWALWDEQEIFGVDFS